MLLNPHPLFHAAKEWFEQRKCQSTSIEGMYFRLAGPKFTNAAGLVSGEGAYLGGGRWNPRNVMRVVYLSDSPSGAAFESEAYYRYFGLPMWKGMPKVLVAVHVAARQVIDLTDGVITGDLPAPMGDLMAEDWRLANHRNNESLTQAMGRAAMELGIGGLVVPSKPSPKSKNIVIFPENLADKDDLSVANAGLLDWLGR